MVGSALSPPRRSGYIHLVLMAVLTKISARFCGRRIGRDKFAPYDSATRNISVVAQLAIKREDDTLKRVERRARLAGGGEPRRWSRRGRSRRIGGPYDKFSGHSHSRIIGHCIDIQPYSKEEGAAT